MKFSNWTDPQFIDANGTGGLNMAMSGMVQAFANAGSGSWSSPGLVVPDTATLTASGLSINATLPPPWGLVSSGGVLVRAHGTQSAADTQTYSTSFSSLVPGSGSPSITAYLAATVSIIQQNPFPIPGPPEGHPSFNPNYIPSIGYATNTFTVALSAVSGGIDNVNTFELCRVTLASGMSSLGAPNVAFQARAGTRQSAPNLLLASGGTLSPWQAQYVLSPGGFGLTHTLPAAAVCAGDRPFRFVNTTVGTWTVVVSGMTAIQGWSVSGATNLEIPPNGAGAVWSNGIEWWLVEANPILESSLIGGSTVNSGYGYPIPVGWLGIFGNGSYRDFGAAGPGTYSFTAPVTGPYRWRLLGGGGGGSTRSGSTGGGAGGGGGGYVQHIVDLNAGDVITGIVVGAGGAVSSTVTGNNGTASSVTLDVALSAAGGAGGSTSTGGAGGAGSGGNQLNYTGGTGGGGGTTAGTSAGAGAGAGTQLGNGGNGGATGGGGGGIAGNPGGPGGGGSAFGGGNGSVPGPNMVGATNAAGVNTLGAVARFPLDGFWGGGGGTNDEPGGPGGGGGGTTGSSATGGIGGGGGAAGSTGGNGGTGGWGGGGGGGVNAGSGGSGAAGGQGDIVVEW